jgi:hypothetical protein
VLAVDISKQLYSYPTKNEEIVNFEF